MMDLLGVLSHISHYLVRLLAAVTVFLIYILLAIFILCFLPYEFIVFVLAKIFDEDFVEFPRGVSHSFVVHGLGKKPLLNMSMSIVFDGELSLGEYQRLFQERLVDARWKEDKSLRFDKLQQYVDSYLGLSIFRWDRKFNIANHVRKYDYDEEENQKCPSPCSEKDLQRITGVMLGKSWGKGRSPWEFLLIYNYREEPDLEGSKVVILGNIHHILGDGFSGYHLKKSLFRYDDIGIVMPQPSHISRRERWLRGLVYPWKLCWDSGLQFMETLQADRAWTTGGEPSREYFCALTRYPVTRVKALKNRLEVSYLSVLISVIIGAVHRLMLEANRKIPKTIALYLPLPKLPIPDGMSNRTTATIMNIPVGPNENVEDIRTIHNILMSKRQSLAAEGMILVCGMIRPMPNALKAFILQNYSHTACLSNMPAALKGFEFEGGKCVWGSVAVGPASNYTGMTFSLNGENGLQTVSVTMDKKVFPCDKIFAKLGSYLHEEFLKLELMTTEESPSSRDALISGRTNN